MDAIDFAQDLAERHRVAALADHTARTHLDGPSRILCEACDRPIPPARRAALPGVARCTECQEALERGMGR
jgi:phage/conjugal plasmid C-4 type zinc finger TraR family protein